MSHLNLVITEEFPLGQKIRSLCLPKRIELITVIRRAETIRGLGAKTVDVYIIDDCVRFLKKEARQEVEMILRVAETVEVIHIGKEVEINKMHNHQKVTPC